ncbi:unnamed protein product [Lymnaea stagnalis]|uniref:Fibrinogen C-terminal domain-containing protein n=1 Tax=Lymnaea stagnalis TaxID=6523 RepID=A0AAV2HX27_LYMST
MRDFWLGLDKIHYLNAVARLQQLNMVINLGSDLNSYTFVYTGVVVGGADTNYSLSYTDVTVVTNDTNPDGRFLNCFSGNGPVPFSTPDADHDRDLNLNCAAEAGAGWWFSQCDPNPECNPLGLHYVTGNEAVTPKRMRFNGVEMQKHAYDFTLFRMYFSDPY